LTVAECLKLGDYPSQHNNREEAIYTSLTLTITVNIEKNFGKVKDLFKLALSTTTTTLQQQHQHCYNNTTTRSAFKKVSTLPQDQQKNNTVHEKYLCQHCYLKLLASSILNQNSKTNTGLREGGRG